MSKIYTKTGDKGETSLLSGSRVKKSDRSLETYGQVDHLNSMIGILIQNIKDNSDLDGSTCFLTEVQNNLFNLGSLLACPIESREKFKLTAISSQMVLDVESQIDLLDKALPKLSNFILPGGSLAASHAHLCRTQVRNLERTMIRLFEMDELPENSLVYINRLSDYFFNLSRFINLKLDVRETIWKAN